MKRKRCCRVAGCSGKILIAFGYCERHYYQNKRYGKIFKRTLRDPNEIIDYGEYIGVVLYNRKHEKITEALVDKQDAQLVMEHKWHKHGKGYAVTNIKIKKNGTPSSVFMHNLIFPVTEMTDHINRNRVDNRRSNLRECTCSENNRNRSTSKNNTSGITGVSYRKDQHKWISRIAIHGKRINLGRFINMEDAVKARKEAEQKYFGEFAPTT